MSHFVNSKDLRFTAVCIIVAVFLAPVCTRADRVAKNPPPHQPAAKIMEESPEAALAINSACDKILRGDFVSAREIVRKSAALDGKALRQLKIIVDEYMAIKARRKTSQNDVHQEQIDELGKLRQKDFPKAINDINQVFTVASKALEYANKEQEQALLRDPLLIRTVQKAKAVAAEFESKGKW
ncbi:hypothetical protein KA005_18470, partial [bacterium]|nr:hypothetical protein [bacterium]